VEGPDYPDARLLALPNVPAYRESSATLTKNPVLPQGADDYQWPPVTQSDLTTTAIRLAAAPVAATPGNDDYQVELDAAWLDLYGWEKPRPPESQPGMDTYLLVTAHVDDVESPTGFRSDGTEIDRSQSTCH
jgi:hypothetical protein